MEDGALPQRPNARRRMRAQEQDSAEPASEQGLCTPTSSGRAFENPGSSEYDLGLTQLGESDIAENVMAVENASRRSELDKLTHSGDRKEDNFQGILTNEDDQGWPSGIRMDVGSGEALPAYRSAAVGTYKFEYLDHTADVQLHAWGHDLKEAFENCALAMFNYISPLEYVRPRTTRRYRAEGHDLPSLLFAFLDELLFVFSTELFLATDVKITALDRNNFIIEAEGEGEIFDRDLHEVGTEIKAITYSAMSIVERPEDSEVFVIVDI
ncbi:hypothetical protein VaNZ11_005908 [Volvox africanus]|uniref:Archease domain-containing protein n=1 Tax=Volvox africanus TaxID=51714 RepID=A0ABQ5RZK0_9CHLO|nr:hypothetical protein VaNZ11_005908 [Volvox africanus]